MKIKIAIIDDQDIIRIGIQQFLSDGPHLEFLGGFADVEGFCRGSGHPFVDVVILDDTLPATRVLDSVQLIQDACPQASILVLGDRLNGGEIRKLLQQGVLGFVCKHEPLRETVLMGIRRVHDFKVHFSPEAALISRQIDTSVTLSPRLTQVLELIAQGYHIQEIAQELNISPRAVYAARARLREAVGVQTDAQLGAEAMRRGLLSDR